MRIVRAGMPGFESLWREWHEDEVFYPLYQPKNVEYYKSYFAQSQFIDCSFVLEEQGRTQAVFCVAVEVGVRGRSLSGFGLPIYCVDKTSGTPWRRTAHRQIREEFGRLIAEHSVSGARFRDLLPQGKISLLSHFFLGLGARATLEFVRVIDLSGAESDLHAQITKSNRSQVSWGMKNLELRVLNKDTIQRADIEQFRLLHIHASGKETRAPKTWDAQYDMITEGEAFAITASLNEEVVSAALFQCSQRWCYYGVSASKRELFDRPISHAVLWRAVLYAKGLGCQSFEMGAIKYPGHLETSPTQKELGISTFKQGFGGQTQVWMDIDWVDADAVRDTQ